ncbi:MAG TPA: peptidylprolyl isomerase [Candidatus Polarisedimenticolaceae bacterium]
MKAMRGNVVKLHYILTDDSGEVIENSRPGDDPIEYLHGFGGIIPGLERALEGTETGHRATVRIAPEDAYGKHDPAMIFEVGKDQLPDGMPLEVGIEVESRTPDGTISLVVTEVRENGVVLDGNHPLAGKTLQFDVEIMGIRAATPEEIAHGHVHGAHGHHH